jgi:DNA-binding CsgD family transcriptional regulator
VSSTQATSASDQTADGAVAALVAKLAPGQVECLLLVDQHLSSREIGAELKISPHTVDQRIRQALGILGVERRTQAASIVAQVKGPYQSLIHSSREDGFAQASNFERLVERAASGGAKLGRSETVTVRLDPKLNYLCELAARAQRRTKSSFIEWAIAESLGSVSLPEVTRYDGEFGDVRDVTLKEKASELWEVDEPDRLAALALVAPALLTHEEQLIWRLIRENGYLWKGHYDKQDEWTWKVSGESLVLDRLRDKWDVFKAVALGELPKDKLPKWPKSRPKPTFDTDLDDDVPF